MARSSSHHIRQTSVGEQVTPTSVEAGRIFRYKLLGGWEWRSFWTRTTGVHEGLVALTWKLKRLDLVSFAGFSSVRIQRRRSDIRELSELLHRKRSQGACESLRMIDLTPLQKVFTVWPDKIHQLHDCGGKGHWRSLLVSFTYVQLKAYTSALVHECRL